MRHNKSSRYRRLVLGGLSKALPTALAACAVLLVAARQVSLQVIHPPGACADFEGDVASNVTWHLRDCVNVWTTWLSSVSKGLAQPYADRSVLREIGEHLRKRGSACYINLPRAGDGMGSSSIRYLATWIFAEEMGCQWVAPVWAAGKTSEEGETTYCHDLPTREQKKNMTTKEIQARVAEACTVVNMQRYFGFNKRSTELPDKGVIKVVQV